MVDDAHLLEPASAALVHHLVATRSVDVVLTVRSGEPAPDAIVAFWKDAGLPRLALGPLDREAVARIAGHMLGGAVDARTARWL